jgi:hypothetical protein
MKDEVPDRVMQAGAMPKSPFALKKNSRVQLIQRFRSCAAGSFRRSGLSGSAPSTSLAAAYSASTFLAKTGLVTISSRRRAVIAKQVSLAHFTVETNVVMSAGKAVT